MSKFALWGEDPDKPFTVTREELQNVAKMSVVNEHAGVSQLFFEAQEADGHQRITHARTVHHLREARRELRRLRVTVAELDDDLDGWRGETGAASPAPQHYFGDSYVTCSRAMESAASQPTVTERTPMQTWWWMCAFKYVWRMWSKDDPRADAEKAIDCLRRAVIGVAIADE